jgi:DNA-binding MarR family transcriptional regulator
MPTHATVSDTATTTGRPQAMPNNKRFHELNDEDAKTFRKLQRAIEAFRSLDPRMPSSYIAAFLAVVLEPGKGPTEYAQDLGTIQPIMSRVLLEIGTKARMRDEGLQLVDRQVSDVSLRNQEYFLTPKGRQLMNQLLRALRD